MSNMIRCFFFFFFLWKSAWLSSIYTSSGNKTVQMYSSFFFFYFIYSCFWFDARALFATVDRLTNPPVPVASEHLSARACHEFSSFFTDKILKISKVVSDQTRYRSCSCDHLKLSLVPWHNLIQSIKKKLQDIIWHLTSSSCCLDILPAGFFKIVSDCKTPDLLQIVNMSVLSGVYPQTMITVVIKPLLQKKRHISNE